MTATLYRTCVKTIAPLLAAVIGLSGGAIASASGSQGYDMALFTPPANSAAVGLDLSGHYQLIATEESAGFEVLRDDYQFNSQPKRQLKRLPAINLNLVQSGNWLVPEIRGPRSSSHPQWEYSVEPGQAWLDKGSIAVSLPLNLRERNANCVHNGMLRFTVDAQSKQPLDSKAYYQFASETCMYFKFNAWGSMAISMELQAHNKRDDIIEAFQREQQSQLPLKPIKALFAGSELAGFNIAESINAEHVSAYGVVVDGIHYSAGCPTRLGAYPYCNQLLLPSYSLAKSVFAGLSLMRLEHRFPGIKQQKIIDYVPECKAAGHWQDVTFEHAADMATGVHNSIEDRADEWSPEKDRLFFFGETHAQKIDFACKQLRKKIPAGSKMIYHTSDTYVLGTALNRYLKRHVGEQADLFADVFADSHRLPLSPVTQSTLRTYDELAQPFVGFGLNFYRDDVAKLGQFFANDAVNADWLDQTLVQGAMQLNAHDRGYSTTKYNYQYNNGFWAKNHQSLLACKQPYWVVEMSGYGGHSVLMFPDGKVFYLLADGGEFYVSEAIKTLHKLSPLCH